jgi:hypothetical protein
MKKALFILVMLTGLTAVAGQVGLPVEQIAFPAVQGNFLVCVWDDAAESWVGSFTPYNNLAGSYRFQVPEWGKWYWIGLWDQAKEQYVFAKWIGHFKTD